jgi:RNA polymerase-binding transcription factor DksA
MTQHLSEADLRVCEQLLLTRRGAVRAELLGAAPEADRRSQLPVAPDVHDWKDDAFANLIASVRSSELLHLRAELTDIIAALHRIAEGSFGACTECGREIARDRLLVQPSAGRCISCQERAEQRRVAESAREPAPPPP